MNRSALRLLIIFSLRLSLCLGALSLHALDRNAFTFIRYDLKASVHPASQRFEASGAIELRNDSSAPQSAVSLQISSSLSWSRITLAEGKPVGYITQTYTSDIDHTGALDEAIVTLHEPVAPQSTVKFEVSYGGEITRDSGRLTRIGTPERVALGSDWDEIGAKLAAVRGLGYVTWYPVSIEAVSLSEGNAVFDALGRWRQRHRQTAILVALSISAEGTDASSLSILTNGNQLAGGQPPEPEFSSSKGVRVAVQAVRTEFSAGAIPVFVVGEFIQLEQPALTVYHGPGKAEAARNYADSAGQAERVLADWFGPLKQRPSLVELPNGVPFESGTMLLAPLREMPEAERELLLARVLAHGSITSPRKWISEGLARFGQALVRERQAGRAAAQDFLARVLPPLVELEMPAVSAAPPAQRAESESLINTQDELLYSGKAAYVWWMLRDIAGDGALVKALAGYRPAEDRDAAYVQRLIEAQFTPRRDLEAFFDSWVYRDLGLPDFRIAAANARETLENNYVISVTVENLTKVWAEVPVTLRAANGNTRSARLQAPGNGKSTVRIVFLEMPKTAEVNDGSVPEMDYSNNTKEVRKFGEAGSRE